MICSKTFPRDTSAVRIVVPLFSRALFVVFLVFFALLSSHSLALGDSPDRASRIRAALVYYVVKFVSWPAQAASLGSRPMRICVYGKDSINDYLEEVMTGKSVQNRSIQVTFPNSSLVEELDLCDVVFLGPNSPDSVRKFVASQKSEARLSICAMDSIRWGECTIQLFVANNKARLAVDLDRAKAAGLRIDSELLEVAQVRP